jgi:hypothetical protein
VNFGEYRKYDSGYEEFHTGVDLATRESSNIFPVMNGVVGAICNSDNAGYGWSVVLEHQNNMWQSSYSHLKPRSVSYNIGLNAETTMEIGKQGHSGYALGDHLHLCFGESDMYWIQTDSSNIKTLHLNYAKLKNPLNNGLNLDADEIRAGTCEVYLVNLNTKKEIKESNIKWVPDKGLRIIVESYDKTTMRRFKTNPYKISFKIYDMSNDNDEVFNEETKFDDLKFGGGSVAKVSDIYNLDLGDLFKTKSVHCKQEKNSVNKFYFYKDWRPTSFGHYKVIVAIYDLVNGFEVLNSTAEKKLNVGALGVDFNWGIYMAGIDDGPRIDYDVGTTLFSTKADNLLGVTDTSITAKAASSVKWSVEIFHPSGSIIKIIAGGTGSIMDVSWDGCDNYGFHLTTPSIADETLIERYVTIGMNMVDYFDDSIAYAWLPDDIAPNKGVMLASVPAPASTAGIRASGVSASGASAVAIPDGGRALKGSSLPQFDGSSFYLEDTPIPCPA